MNDPRAPQPPTAGAVHPTSDLLKRAHAVAREHHFDAVVVTDLDGTIVDWNRGSERLYGYARREALGQSVTILHVPEDREARLAGVLAAVERDGRWEGILPLLRKDGSRGWIESAVVPVLDDSGRTVGALGINRDITARVEAERQLSAAREQFRVLVEHALVGIYIIRGDRFIYVNPRFEAMFGYTAAELTHGDVRILDLVAAEDRTLVADNVRARFEGEPLERHYGFRAVRRNGALVDVEVHGARIDLDGAPALMGMVLDVTGRREAERRLQESEERHRRIVDDLFSRMADVLASRNQLREQLLPQAEVGLESDATEIQPDDRRFLSDVRSAVLRNLSDETYSVARLARDVAHSRSQLHRRLRALVNETPSHLLWRMRLEQAAQRLTHGTESISEIAFAVGFKSVAHFSNRFAEHFGVRPSAYRGHAP